MESRYDYLIVGAGLVGSTFAYLATKAGKRCLVIDRRDHTGGNIYCENIEGIDVHKYGAHIFHTSDRRVWDFVNSIVEFEPFINSPVARYGNELYNLPFNMNTFHQLWGVITPEEARQRLEAERSEAVAALGGRQPENLEEQAQVLVGREIYEKLIKGYTEKQWGRPCSELPPFIIKRLPVRYTYDNNYFNDLYQGIPAEGYNPIIDRLLIDADVRLGCDFFDHREELSALADKIVYTGPIDRYFDYSLGRLQYRSLRFDSELLQEKSFQGNAVVNYTEASVPYTRIIEHKFFYRREQELPSTVITREYPAEWDPTREPYYPVNDERNNRLAEQYRELSSAEPGVIFIGRLAQYRYLDMAPCVAEVLDAWERLKN